MLDTWEDVDAVPVVPYYDGAHYATYDEVEDGVERDMHGDVTDAGARSLLRTGDVLVCVGETRRWWHGATRPVWRAIQRATDHPVTHVGMVWVTPEAVLVVESLARRGVTITALSRQIPGLDDGKYHVASQDSHLFVMRPTYSVSGAWSCAVAQEENAKLAIREAIRHEGTDYPEWLTVRLAWARLTGWMRPVKNRMICSEHIAQSVEKGGAKTPADLPMGLRSPGAVANACEMVACLWHPKENA